jgi:hypothetical protein
MWVTPVRTNGLLNSSGISNLGWLAEIESDNCLCVSRLAVSCDWIWGLAGRALIAAGEGTCVTNKTVLTLTVVTPVVRVSFTSGIVAAS